MDVKIRKNLLCFWPIIAYLALAVSAFATNDFDQQALMLACIMLLFPMLDNEWNIPILSLDMKHAFLWAAMIFIAIVVICLEQDHLIFFFSTLIFVALPEEWFFRGYLMGRIGNGLKANVITSICFAVLHAVTLTWVSSLLVFIPSLFFGWIYQKQPNIVTVVLAHTISNLIFAAYLHQYFEKLYF